jgi:DnaJ-class molecular chaperone
MFYFPLPFINYVFIDNKEEAEDKFQEISEAYEVLSTEELKAKYDRGEDVYDNQGGGGGRQRQHFDPSSFFRQGGGGGGGQQRQGGSHHFHFNSF